MGFIKSPYNFRHGKRHGKRFLDSFSQTAFFGEEKRQPEIRLRSQAIAYLV